MHFGVPRTKFDSGMYNNIKLLNSVVPANQNLQNLHISYEQTLRQCKNYSEEKGHMQQ